MSSKEELTKMEKTSELMDENLEQVSGGVFCMQQAELIPKISAEQRFKEMAEGLESFSKKGGHSQSIEEIKAAMGLNDPSVIKRMTEQNNLPQDIINKMLEG